MERKAVVCPNLADHKGVKGQYVKKTLFFIGKDHLLVFCKKHRWMKVEFSKFGKNIDFSNVSIKISPVKEDIIKNVEAPIISVGSFKKK